MPPKEGEFLLKTLMLCRGGWGGGMIRCIWLSQTWWEDEMSRGREGKRKDACVLNLEHLSEEGKGPLPVSQRWGV